MIEKSTKIIAIFTTLLVLYSITYNWSYFFFDRKIFLALTVSDHIASSINNIYLFIFGVSYGLIFSNLFLNKDENKSAEQEKEPIVFRFFDFIFENKRYSYFIIWTVSCAIIYFSDNDSISNFTICIALTLTWLIYSPSLISKLSSSLNMTREQVFNFILPIPLVFIFALFVGKHDALYDLSKMEGEHSIYLKPQNNFYTDVVLLRAIEKGVYVLNPASKDLMFFNWSDIFYVQKTHED